MSLDAKNSLSSITGSEATGPEKDWTEEDLTGKTLSDYYIRRRLGRGGMGQVYLAEQISLKRDVALKILKPELAANMKSLQRFKREAESVARATHANIVQIYAIGQWENRHYMALEYVEGRNLREFLEKKGTPDLYIGLSIMKQVASALERAGELGIIHRDIKPENILLNRKGEAKLADFGLSRCFEEEQALNLTDSKVALGTPLYMSPEQVESRPVDPRTDIYSFGVTCYHMFAGQPPFRGTSPFEVALQHVQKEPQPLAEIRPDLPPELCGLVHRMMAKKPEARVQTGRELVREVMRVREIAVAANPALPTSGPFALGPQSGEYAPAPPSRTAPALCRERRAPVVLLTLVAALVLGFLGPTLYFWRATTSHPLAVGEPPRASTSSGEREKELRKLVEENIKPEGLMDLATGLKYSIELSVLFLKDRRLDDADKFFAELLRPDQKVKPYRSLGLLGKGMVFAFQDRPDESNAILKKLLTEKGDKMPAALAQFWNKYPPLQEMVAQALYFNYANSPTTFPPELERWRHPPLPGLRK